MEPATAVMAASHHGLHTHIMRTPPLGGPQLMEGPSMMTLGSMGVPHTPAPPVHMSSPGEGGAATKENLRKRAGT